MSDRFARLLTGLAVSTVAVIAATVSFTHIASVAAGHGYTPATAKLLPFSVDGLIVAASLVLLAEARAHRPAPRLARAGLWLGICATLAANVEHGAAFGPVGALVNAWPGVAFVVASEILLGMIRRAGGIPMGESAFETVAEVEPVAVPTGVPGVPSSVADDMPEIEPLTVPASTVPTAPVPVPGTVASRARGRASGCTPKAPEKIFSTEIGRGELPSLRAIKTRAKCGTDRARVIRDQLSEILREHVPEAA